ncbi:hypothetical protein ACLBOM_33145 [Escherichia coli]
MSEPVYRADIPSQNLACRLSYAEDAPPCVTGLVCRLVKASYSPADLSFITLSGTRFPQEWCVPVIFCS